MHREPLPVVREPEADFHACRPRSIRSSWLGRSSSHFTRVARIFALELAVPHTFRPVLDIAYARCRQLRPNPALKVPLLIDARGSLFGTENICHELLRRLPAAVDRNRVVMRGDIDERLLANAEELSLHAMSAEVSLTHGQAAP